MKTIKYLLLCSLVWPLLSCERSAQIQVQNNISQVVIEDVQWGDVYLAGQLLPGESSDRRTIRETSSTDLPASRRISFRMRANNQMVFLETEERFTLDEDDDLLVVLNDSTKVRNPND